ncbi:hypothetical protein D3C72_1635390 [compost metagenome]
MVAMSRPSTVSHACIAVPDSASGRPLAKPSTPIMTMRHAPLLRKSAIYSFLSLQNKKSADHAP